jgi:single-strand DNA-binding protein
MNSCILMAQIVSDPELRSTQDNKSVSYMTVEFEGSREGEPPAKMQVEGWGSLAEEIKNTYHTGDRIIIEGRLSMNLFEMPEGYKEKRAKLVASRVYPMGSDARTTAPRNLTVREESQFDTARGDNSNNMADVVSKNQSQSSSVYHNAAVVETSSMPDAETANPSDKDWDEIPF